LAENESVYCARGYVGEPLFAVVREMNQC